MINRNSPSLRTRRPGAVLLAGVALALASLLTAACGHEKGGHEPMFPNTPPPQAQAKEKEALTTFEAVPPAAATGGELLQPLTVGGDVKAPIVLKRVEADKKFAEGGATFLDVTVDRTGKVREVKVTRAPSDAAGRAWSDAVRMWEFEPGTQNGKPVDVVYTLTVGMAPGV